MLSIQRIFNNSIFRIPDYQRGYSWEKSHLEDFWHDLINLQPDKIHYTGMISVELVKEEEYNKWSEDLWIIKGKGDKPYFIVDGQQRLTTIIILLWVLLKRINEDEQLGFESKGKVVDKYIFSLNEKNNFKSYIFGYHKDNPSYEFLKREIFDQIDVNVGDIPLEETSYTNNLLFAKTYFAEKVRFFSIDELEDIFKKVTQQLQFDYKILDKELDIFVVFETMNNRGKPLSNLEKLKNRLIYLSTLLKEPESKKNILRAGINDAWQVIYSYLGKNKENKLDDDLFLQNHWIMYSRYDRREAEFYANDLFDRKFTSYNLINGSIGYDEINSYLQSISLSVKQWFVINNPSHPNSVILSSNEVLFWLRKQNKLGYKSFAPLIMAVLVLDTEEKTQVDLLKSIEAYVFLIFYVSNRRSNTGSYHFNAQASAVYNKEVAVSDIIKDIQYWIYGESMTGYFDIDSFHSFLKDLFVGDNSSGFGEWKWLRYFLFEYEIDLNNNSDDGLQWEKFKIIDQISPLEEIRRSHPQLKLEEAKNLAKTLGNFVMIDDKQQKGLSFDLKKDFYSLGSKSEKELSEDNVWGETQILSRGIKLLDFLEKRWKVDLGGLEKKKRLLFLDFL